MHPARPPSSASVKLVGRERELSIVLTRLDAMRQGDGGIVLLSGEPGIGKTRLAQETAAEAGVRGIQVVWGRCYEGAGAPAFWPWVQVVRILAEQQADADLHDVLGAEAADIARIVPELAHRLPEIAEPVPLPPDQARFRLLDSLARVLRRAAQHQPLLIILEDLHWADTLTLLMLQFVSQQLWGTRLLVLATYRNLDVVAGGPLADLLGLIARLPACEQLPLRGLSGPEVHHLVEAVNGHSPSPELVLSLVRETDGNPFFIAEVLRLLDEQGQLDAPGRLPVPSSVQGVLRNRLARLTESCRRVMEVASVVGRDFEFWILVDASRMAGQTEPPEHFLQLIDEATAAHIIRSAGLGHHRFMHALVRETLYESLGAAGRARLHAAVGEAIEQRGPLVVSARLSELAHHFAQAAVGGKAARAVEYAARAGDEALGQLAYEAAAEHYRVAIELQAVAERGVSRSRSELLLAMGDAHVRAGDTPQARAAFLEAAALARRELDSAAVAHAALGMGGVVVTPGVVDQQLVHLLQEALEGVPENEPALRARLLARLAMEHYWTSGREAGAALSANAVALARTSGDRRALATALDARRYAMWGPENLDERLAVATELIELAGDLGEASLELQGLRRRIPDLLESGQVAAFDADIARCAHLAREIRQPLYLWYAGIFEALRALMQGEFERAEGLVHEALRRGKLAQSGTAEIFFTAQMCVLRRETGGLAELVPRLEAVIADFPAMPLLRCLLAAAHLDAGRRADAGQIVEALAPNEFAGVPRDALWLSAICTLGSLTIELQQHEHAAVLYRLLLPYADRVVLAGTPYCDGAAAHYLGVLAAALGRADASAAHLAAAATLNRRVGAWPFLARTYYEQAAAAAASPGGPNRARLRALLSEARAIADRVGMPVLLKRIEQLAPSGDAGLPGGLSPREIDVLRLIARGASTKEIAQALVLSPPTVERHITHLYTKIGARGRADATAFALSHGLAPRDPADDGFPSPS